MVTVGATVADVLPVTVPTPPVIERVGAGDPVTDQLRVAVCPAVIEEGVSVNEEMMGAEPAGVTVTVAWAVALPPLFVAVIV